MSATHSHSNKSTNTRIMRNSSFRIAGFTNKPNKFWTLKEAIPKIRSNLSNQSAPMVALEQIIAFVPHNNVPKKESQSSWGRMKGGFNSGSQEDIGQFIIKF